MTCLKGIWNNKFRSLLLLETKSTDKTLKDPKTLIDDEVAMAEDIVKCLSPLKTITTSLCTESVPTI